MDTQSVIYYRQSNETTPSTITIRERHSLQYLLYIGLLFCFNQLFSQTDENKGRIYSEYINYSVSNHDSKFKQNSESVIVSFIKKKELGSILNLKYLEDYLNDNIKNNRTYKIIKDKYNLSPISYFYLGPWGNFGKLLSQDSTFGYMVLDFEKLLSTKYSPGKYSVIKTNYKLEYSDGKIPKDAKKWDKFYKRNAGCFGIIKLSNVFISDKYAVFYAENYHYTLFANGELVFMEYIKGEWSVLLIVDVWKS